MIKLYTIGFTGKTAQRFFELLEQNQVKKIIDTRVNNNTQLSGFAKGKDLEFFLKRLADIIYEHELKLAPTKELLTNYRQKKISWDEYTKVYLQLLVDRNVREEMNTESLHRSCLLCSEQSPEKCHRRLLAEFLQKINPEIRIVHLK
jgi:uncharacterized protein (DUF488 family)